ncbi:MAG: hypothetical protein G01um101448_833 [Parcubacteria group bacterium Gr01-1014_48]|nr:MAG: hypothetical protein Greene041614_518 [Parcubacteria group bacterium Greene0416_14]TSC73269.1 MAG: hypothetical protein G01um101448_833 [Parcubacteria group bacterium Gr01-1014_48]TSD01661.1 MAG: hypothetical protein Greene101415_59 [Parcubacteria group bacterium Greene1014_15]TSD07748.1 MAG: hypothetical protein Greene07144_757 [Parcubacteria group bacterium Greene0714_4]
MALFSFASTQKREVAVVLDIGSGSVGASIVVFEKREQPRILYSTREDIAHYERPGFKRFFRAMLNSLEIATTRLHREALEKNTLAGIHAKNIEHVYCVLASPWYTATTKILLYEKRAPFMVTPALINNLVEGSMHASTTEDLPDKRQAELAMGKNIERKVIQILLNGYETSKPYLQKASRIEVALFTANVGQEIGSRIQSIIRKTWVNRKISFHSFALASFMVTRDLFPKENDFVLLDVTGEVTDIFIVKNGVLIQSCSIPYGKNTLVRDIARSMHSIPAESLSMVREYTTESSAKEAQSNIEKALGEAGNKWVSLLSAIISYVIETESIPRTVYLMSDPDVGALFSKWVNQENVGRRMLGKQGYEVTYLTEKMLLEHVQFAGAKERDFFIGIDAIFLHVLYALSNT